MGALTKPQKELLAEIGRFGPTHVAEHYAPRKALIAAGLIEVLQGRYADHVRITPAGRKALEEA